MCFLLVPGIIRYEIEKIVDSIEIETTEEESVITDSLQTCGLQVRFVGKG